MAVNPRVSMLLDIYGSMLTNKERDALELYYNEDLSLSEIADNEAAERCNRPGEEKMTISRQGVRDTIKRAENKLCDMEEKLGLAEKNAVLRDELTRIADDARAIRRMGAMRVDNPEVERLTAEIISIAESLFT